jgi:hypothetical protein
VAGTKAGGQAAASTNKKKYGKDFYKKIGSEGGKLGTTGGFASNKVGDDGLTGRERAASAGAVGGKKSRRTAKPKVEVKQTKTKHGLFSRLMGKS